MRNANVGYCEKGVIIAQTTGIQREVHRRIAEVTGTRVGLQTGG